MTVTQDKTQRAAVGDWFARRTYSHDQFADIEALGKRKREQGSTVSVVLPAREVATTIGAIVDQIRDVADSSGLVDQILVIDADSSDGTAAIAREHGADVYLEDELMARFGPAIGKGDAMWRALSVANGDLVAYLDSDTTDFGRHFIYGLLGPMLLDPGLKFLKATYSRPFKSPDGTIIDDAGRVTELTAKPLFNAFYPELLGFGQPLSGELIASRELLGAIPFCTGYAVETAMLIDVLGAVGLDAMGQVELGTRHNRYQSLFELGAMAYAVVRAVLMRAQLEERAAAGDLDTYVHAYCPADGLRLEERLVRIVERPPIVEALGK
jgi:glucosyl-3-phosphoglycerate synthase